METDRAGLEVLSRDVCLHLLARTRIGRIGFHAGALPVVLPVAFAVDADSIVVRVLSGSQLDSATRDAVVAFEADDLDPTGRGGWSVTATGVATEISEPSEQEQVRAFPLGDWGSEEPARLVRISLDLISGRRDPGVPCDVHADRDAGAARWEANAAEMAPFRGELIDPEIVRR